MGIKEEIETAKKDKQMRAVNEVIRYLKENNYYGKSEFRFGWHWLINKDISFDVGGDDTAIEIYNKLKGQVYTEIFCYTDTFPIWLDENCDTIPSTDIERCLNYGIKIDINNINKSKDLIYVSKLECTNEINKSLSLNIEKRKKREYENKRWELEIEEKYHKTLKYKIKKFLGLEKEDK